MDGYNKPISIYKLWFSIYIVACHSCYMIQDHSKAAFRGGWISVEFFFIISGLLMVRTALKKDPRPERIGSDTFRFVTHKIGRLFPYYVFAYVVSFVYMHLFQAAHYTPGQLLKEMAESIVPFFFLNLSGLDGYEVVGATWYISAMIIVLMVIYPLLLKNRNYFLWVFAPLAAVLGYGFIRQHDGAFLTTVWNGFYYAGIVRALAGMCLGACVYLAAERLAAKAAPSGAVRWLLTALEVGILVFASTRMYGDVGMDLAIFLIIAFALLTTISFSGFTYTHRLFSKLNIKYIEQFSIALYLSHGRVAGMLGRLYGASADYQQMLPIYFTVCFLTALADVLVVNCALKLYHRWRDARAIG